MRPKIYINVPQHWVETRRLQAGNTTLVYQDFVGGIADECYAVRVVRKAIPKDIRAAVLAIGHCQWCHSTENLAVDHIDPWSLGGSDERGNLQCLCRSCNSRKSNNVLFSKVAG